MTVCRVEGCDRADHCARGLCHKHYEAWRTTLPDRRASKRRSDTAAKRRARGSKNELGRCGECSGVYGVRPDGTFRRPHLNACGSKCRGSDLPVYVIVAAAS